MRKKYNSVSTFLALNLNIPFLIKKKTKNLFIYKKRSNFGQKFIFYAKNNRPFYQLCKN